MYWRRFDLCDWILYCIIKLFTSVVHNNYSWLQLRRAEEKRVEAEARAKELEKQVCELVVLSSPSFTYIASWNSDWKKLLH